MSVPDLVIDPSLKYWVLVPISLALVLFGVLRQSINVLLSPAPRLTQLNKLREQQYLKKAQLFKTNFWNLPKSEFLIRQSHMCDKLNSGDYLADKPTKEVDITQNPFTDPNASDAMMEMAKNSFGNMIAQTAMMGWVNFFFAGFVLMKLPFPLTLRFKQMLQSGVNTSDLDVRWVSSISWYVIAMLGLNSVSNVLFGDGNMASQMMQQQQPMGGVPMMPGAGGPKPDKLMKAEATDIQILPYKHVLENVGDRVLKIYG
ncbi:CYFA0S04e00826g1_1 [Cyberlindnera fabianii]|uniref:ER membrane protein complex subunit 3 n=1 Tax=Cyberlindnera fabianii TaxID=36022 RepID=A0A061AQP2_CYBFA|nr:ER membrane protein complex subunit 3 [Cyberlindnera fabianii]CDR39950.1 CYFA0S04e00826g1_1 [Cyberlindnera fabianii]